MTSIFTDRLRHDPAAPVALTPQAASDGGPDSGDGAGIGVDFFVSLSATLGSIADTLQADRERRDGGQPPADEQIFASGVVPTGGTLLLDLGSVPLGRIWQIRRLVCGGATAVTTAAGTAYVFAQGTPPSDLNLTNLCDILTPLPRGNTYGTHQFFLKPTEHLWVAFVGATVGQQLTASSRVESFEAGAYRRGVYSE
jgi:hypothetical protein